MAFVKKIPLFTVKNKREIAKVVAAGEEEFCPVWTGTIQGEDGLFVASTVEKGTPFHEIPTYGVWTDTLDFARDPCENVDDFPTPRDAAIAQLLRQVLDKVPLEDGLVVIDSMVQVSTTLAIRYLVWSHWNITAELARRVPDRERVVTEDQVKAARYHMVQEAFQGSKSQ